MKNQLVKIFFLLPFLAFGQYDFETRYFTINSTSLPEAPQFDSTEKFNSLLSNPAEVKSGTFTLDKIPTFAATLRSYRINTSNYWQPVDMMGAVSKSKNYTDSSLMIAPEELKGLRFTVYTADSASKVTNTVYTEVRGLDLLSPCPPHGICPRCAPYRSNRGF